jgi:hypothetical protein
MTKIRVQYWHNGQPYRLDQGIFKREELLSYTNRMQDRYKAFADKINASGGWLDVTLSANTKEKHGIHFEPELSAVAQDLKSEIEKLVVTR